MREKRFQRVPALRAAGAFAVLLCALGAGNVLAFVPSCEQELAQAYPPVLKADLTACKDPAARVASDSPADLDKLVRRLRGTWKLRSRTEQGITVSNEARYSRLYFDLDTVGGQVRGAALLLDRANEPQAARASMVAGFWGVQLRQKSPSRIQLSLSGEALGSYAHVRVPKVSSHELFEQSNVFVTAFDANAPAAGWDRIVVMDNSLTYVSCKDGVVERYVRMSGQKPVIEGASLEDYFKQLKEGGKSARLGTPSLGIAAAFGR